jgi:hypothetical protein
MPRFLDLTDRRFGRLVAVGIARERTKSKGYKWVCKCDCGKETIVASTSLMSESIVSCGCYRAERVKKARKPRRGKYGG